jgi:hypothetical protein
MADVFKALADETRRLILDELAARDRDLLQGLLSDFAREYAQAKARESALDFEDLQLYARDLLQGHEDIREQERWRFRSIMVDEFQDTNRLQCELVDLLAGEELFFVGDEFQSIYSFRHADVEVFRERRAEARKVLPLTRKYRARPEVLSVINHLFSADFGEEFQPLVAGAPRPLGDDRPRTWKFVAVQDRDRLSLPANSTAVLPLYLFIAILNLHDALLFEVKEEQARPGRLEAFAAHRVVKNTKRRKLSIGELGLPTVKRFRVLPGIVLIEYSQPASDLLDELLVERLGVLK